jgi:hypothetical protein
MSSSKDSIKQNQIEVGMCESFLPSNMAYAYICYSDVCGDPGIQNLLVREQLLSTSEKKRT